MTAVFDRYSAYYDLLYRDKDYAGEVDFVRRLVERHVPDASTLLDLGCGTGVHARLLAEAGYTVHGVDGSTTMLDRAAARRAAADPAVRARLGYSHGDVRDHRLGRTFDAVCALFHVLSYQTDNDDLIATFATAAAHLRPGGVFVFDYWFAPAVLTERPVVRVKRLEDEHLRVTRIAEPTVDERRNVVTVDYRVLIQDRATDRVDELRERHLMRYLSIPEVELAARACGFRLVDSREWLTGRAPGADTWGVCSVAVKEGDRS